jgi:hypothetical protein
MNVDEIAQQLKEQRSRVDAAIQALEGTTVDNLASASKYVLTTGRATGMSIQAGWGVSAITTMREVIGFVNTNASSAANFFTIGTTPHNPLFWDTSADSTNSAFLGFSSVSGSYGSTANGDWIFVTCDGSTCHFVDTTIAAGTGMVQTRVWEDATKTSTGCSGTNPCWCGAIASQTATVGTYTTKCTDTNTPVAGTNMAVMFGIEGNGGSSPQMKTIGSFLKAMQ